MKTAIALVLGSIVVAGQSPATITTQDRIEIQALVTAYAGALGRCAAAEFADLFADRGYFASGFRGHVVGRERFMAMVESERHCLTTAGAALAPRPGTAPTTVVDVTPAGVVGIADLGAGGHYEDEYVKTSKGWRFAGRTVVTPAEQAAGLNAREMMAIRRLASGSQDADDFWAAGQDGVKRFRSSGVVINVGGGVVNGRVYLKDGGHYEDVYEKSAGGQWRIKTRAKTSFLDAQGPGARSAPAYTAGQAAAGKAAYDQSCASCHGGSLDDGALAPPLKGVAFMQKYGGKRVEELLAKVSTMPPASPNALDAATTAALTAYVLQSNAILAGTSELPSSGPALAAMTIPVGGFSVTSFSPYAPALPAVTRANPLDNFTSVSDAQLVEPAAQDWLTWRRAYDAQGFSPLTQINPRNVSGLRVAWSWPLPAGSSESTPLVHDGVMFVQGANDKVQALDARTGDLLWQFERRLPQGVAGSFKRGMALHGNRLYIGTSDDHVVALDAKTGAVVWDQVVGDPSVREQIGGGPLVAKGKVMIGTVGTGVGAKPGGPEIVGLDAETGAIAWRVHTIAQPGTPGGDSWNGMSLQQRSGASVWTPGSYDPRTELAYFGTGNTYDTGPLRTPSTAPGVTNDALYTDSTLAIEPDTGKIRWFYQHHPNDQWDLDWAFERQLLRLPVNGEPRTVAFTAGKIGIYDALDAESGKYLFSIDLGLNNLVTSIDPKTGAKTTDPSLVPGDGQVKMVCPHAAGAKNWLPASYNPASKTVFVPLVEACMDLFPVPGGGRGGLSTGVNLGVRPRPNSDGNYGRLQAINLETRKTLWTVRQRAPQTTGALATAGGVVFVGALDRYFRAYDAANGKVLWQTRLSDVSSSPPISYAVNGKQYVALVVGRGGFHYASYAPLVPELAPPPDRGSAVMVFELP